MHYGGNFKYLKNFIEIRATKFSACKKSKSYLKKKKMKFRLKLHENLLYPNKL